ncbi:MAG TPA: fibronectin type III-like domain-contianing protein, partial [Pseudonocardiaceae bacterium]|nr:fibronectin type III-like domain-contianing protein [Pseudonocardiaceae bacterium]
RYTNLRLSTPTVDQHGSVRATVDVTNTGSRAGSDVVQLYTDERHSRTQQPVEQLRGFQRITLSPGQTRTVTITVRAADLATWDVTRNRSIVETGWYDVRIGHSATDASASAPLFVHGEVIPPRDLTRPTQAQNFDDYAGITLTDQSKTAGTSVAATAAGDWISFADTAPPAGPARITASVANAGSTPAHVTVRLDNPTTGQVLGTLTVAPTGGHYDYVTATAPLAKASAPGPHTVYLVFDAPMNLFTFQFSRDRIPF